MIDRTLLNQLPKLVAKVAELSNATDRTAEIEKYAQGLSAEIANLYVDIPLEEILSGIQGPRPKFDALENYTNELAKQVSLAIVKQEHVTILFSIMKSCETLHHNAIAVCAFVAGIQDKLDKLEKMRQKRGLLASSVNAYEIRSNPDYRDFSRIYANWVDFSRQYNDCGITIAAPDALKRMSEKFNAIEKLPIALFPVGIIRLLKNTSPEQGERFRSYVEKMITNLSASSLVTIVKKPDEKKQFALSPQAKNTGTLRSKRKADDLSSLSSKKIKNSAEEVSPLHLTWVKYRLQQLHYNYFKIHKIKGSHAKALDELLKQSMKILDRSRMTSTKKLFGVAALLNSIWSSTKIDPFYTGHESSHANLIYSLNAREDKDHFLRGVGGILQAMVLLCENNNVSIKNSCLGKIPTNPALTQPAYLISGDDDASIKKKFHSLKDEINEMCGDKNYGYAPEIRDIGKNCAAFAAQGICSSQEAFSIFIQSLKQFAADNHTRNLFKKGDPLISKLKEVIANTERNSNLASMYQKR